ncbi:STAS domain-containing protein [Streptomyces sp. NBC_00490]
MVSDAPCSTEHLTAYQHRGCTVLAFHGEIDIAAAIAIRPHLTDLATSPTPSIVIDLTPTSFFDCSGVALLCCARRRIRARGGSLHLVCPHPLTLRILHVLGLDDLLHPVRTLEDALAGTWQGAM